MDDAKALYYLDTLPPNKFADLSPATIDIIAKFREVKVQHQHHLDALKVICLKNKLAL